MADERSHKVLPGFVEPTFGQRLLARLIDAAVLLPVALLIGIVAQGQTRTASGMVVAAAYEVLFVTRRGQTVGKIMMGTRIVDRASGSVPGIPQVVLRWLVLIAGSLVVLAIPALEILDIAYTLVVVLPILRPPLHRGVHDMAARTVVTSTRTAPPT